LGSVSADIRGGLEQGGYSGGHRKRLHTRQEPQSGENTFPDQGKGAERQALSKKKVGSRVKNTPSRRVRGSEMEQRGVLAGEELKQERRGREGNDQPRPV